MKPTRIIIGGILLIGYLLPLNASPLFIDHTCVDLFTNLTDADIARVKTMWVDILGASHASGYRIGCQLLQDNVDGRFRVNSTESGVMEGNTTNHLRISTAYWKDAWTYGGDESTWYTSQAKIDSTKAHLAYCNTNDFGLSVFGLGWSWQMSWQNLNSSAVDPVYHVRWSGSSLGGPDGNLAWGLNDSSYPYTTNHVSAQTYLDATEQYRSFCKSNGYATVVIFSTAPVDFRGGEFAYQVFLKNNYIRNYVSNTTDAVLFDYADILCWDNAGNRATNNWTDLSGDPQIYEWIADDNKLNLDGSFGGSNSYHIGQRGAIRVAKALWYMMSRVSAVSAPLRAEIENASGGTNFVIQWNAQADKTYSVLQSTNLSVGEWQIVTNNLVATPPFNRFTGSVDQSSSFFKIKEQ